jgi:glycosyltransferase involved in cell wall biosynthesis
MDASLPIRLELVAPALDGPPTGGTLYNRALLAALRDAGSDLRATTLAPAANGDGPAKLTCSEIPENASTPWVPALRIVDSLYLAQLPALQAGDASIPLWLLLHYLPAQVHRGRTVALHELSASERDALAVASAVIATSPFMAHQLAVLGLDAGRVLCVEPGVTAVERVPAEHALHALVLGNVTRAKGQLELLAELAVELRADDSLQLELVGALDAEPEHAAQCTELVAREPALRGRVVLRGALAHEAALDRLARASVLVSASRIESYGMALSEARAAGVPIIARDAGHAAAHVSADAGGTLCPDARTIARELLTLARTPALLARRDALARAARRARSWPQAAAELLAYVRMKREG